MNRNFITSLFLVLLSAMLFPQTAKATSVIVTNSADNGPGSLREAVFSASPGDMIEFSPATNGMDFTLISGEIFIDKPLTISGNDSALTVLSGNDLIRIFSISNAGTVIFKNLKLTQGNTIGNGGAMMITNSSVQLISCAVSHSVASVSGGAIFLMGGELVVNGSSFYGNIAGGNAANEGGGAIANAAGDLKIKNGTVITGNAAIGTSGSGGGILNNTAGMLAVNGSTISMNHANRAGGGIEDNSGATTVVRLTDVTFTGNTTGATPGNGGAVHITGPGNMLITGGVVSGNTATAEGGGLWNGTGEMVISGVLIDGNTASGNPADQGGGGVFNNGGSVIIKNGTNITHNTANGTSGSGGGVMNDVGGKLTINSSTISMNHANRAGGGIEDNSGATTVVRLTDVTFTGNTTGATPGNGGAVHITGPGNMLITGGVVSGNTAAREGGGLWNGSGQMTVRGVTIDNNTANGPATDDGGGGVFNNGGTLKIDASTLSNNLSTGSFGNGGGVHNNSGRMTILYSTISGNTSNNQGGGISNRGIITLLNTTLTQNMALNNGGGFSQNMITDTAIFKSSLIAENTATSGQDVFSAGMLKSLGYNLVGLDDLAIFPSKSTDITGTSSVPVDPMLDILADNGGATQTHALLCGSMAIDAGDPGNNSADQREMGLFNGRRDIGAFELQTACSASANRKASTQFESISQSLVYPNPATEGWIQIEIPVDQINTQAIVRLADLTTGKTIRENRELPGSIKMNIRDLVSGTYLVQVIYGEKVSTHKLIVMN